MPPSASGTVAAGPELKKAIQDACSPLRQMFLPKDDDEKIKKNLKHAWLTVHNAISNVGDPNLKECFRDLPEFNEYVKSKSSREHELVKLLRNMAKQDPEVPWEYLFINGTLLSSL